MDPGFPRGGLDELFKQYDGILLHTSSQRSEATPSEKADLPPWAPPAAPTDVHAETERLVEQRLKEHAEERRKEALGIYADADLKKSYGADPRSSWREVDAQRAERAEKKSSR
jgi:hypothetical protein